MLRAFVIAGLALYGQPALAARFFTDSVLPEGISSGCRTALTADVACSPAVPALQAGTFYPKAELEAICTDSCASSLASYHDAILSACSSDTWEGFQDIVEPVALISEMIRYHFNFTCITDGTRFCNNVAAAYAVFLDPETAALPGGLPAGGDYGGYVVSDPCDDCLVRNLRFLAGSPYYMGPDMQESSEYQSRTSSCGIAGSPLTTTTLSIFSPTVNVPSTPTCAGTTYTIQPGDDCHSISLSQGIGTDWLITDNDLTAYCHNFPTTGTLCLVNKCDVYTVAQGDTCKSIARAHDISEAQLRAWNPSIDAGCYNLNTIMMGHQLCVSKPGERYVSPAPTTIQPSIPTTPAPVPTDIADQTNPYCGRYYKAVLGDFCNLITMKFGISLSDFRFLNPAINENCTNLFAEESYCVQAVGDINTYSGRPGHITFSLTYTSGAGFEDSATTLPPVAWTSPTPTTTQLPLASGSRADCASYLVGAEYQKNLQGTFLLSNCELAATVLGVTLEDFGIWNPSLVNVSGPDCAFDPGLRYCGQWYEGGNPPEETPQSSRPVREGMTPNCTVTIDVDENGDPPCTLILEQWDLTIEQFFAWNPSVGADCSGMWAGYQYCVKTNQTTPTPTSTSSTSTTTSATTETPTPPGPTQAGQPANCNKWHLVAQANEDCGVVESAYSLTHAQFLEWNPAVSSDCLSGFWLGYAYCVGVSSSSGGTTTTTSTTIAGPTNTPVPAPEPNQAGNAIATCNEYGQAQDGDWCAAFADRHGISLADLYAWNSVLGAGGENCGTMFWSGYWYCIGVVG